MIPARTRWSPQGRRGLPAGAVLGSIALCFGSSVVSAQTADPKAAEQQYRVARRLAAEGSSEAVVALQRVVELDPKGRLADDALVEQAMLEGIPRWPEELGKIDGAAAGSARALLGRVLQEFSQADRAGEARLLHSLLRIEPLPGRDASAARHDLLTVAGLGAGETWSGRARYIIGWLDEQRGNDERARAAYQRLVVDLPQSTAADRARVGLARIELREGRFGAAARWLQQAIERNVSADTAASSLRELAVRLLLRREGMGGGWGKPSGPRSSVDVRNPSGMARLPDGGLLLLDRRGATVKRLDATGRAVAEWPLNDLLALTVDGMGRAFVAAGERIHRLDPNGSVAVAGQGDFAPVSALASDSIGRLWVVDRKGTRVGRLDVGATQPVDVWAAADSRVSLLVWDGRRLVAVDGRHGKLFEIDDKGSERIIASRSGLQKPVSIAADPAGQVAVLDSRVASVVLFDRDGSVRERYSCARYGIVRPVAIALGPDGSLDLLDASSAVWTRLP